MKKVVLIALIACTGLVSCNSGSSSTSDQVGEIENKEGVKNGRLEFEETNFDFGAISEGDVVTHAFKFKNVGTDPVEITAVNVSCGCTVASKPMKAIGVGMEDEIVIDFNSSGKPGVNSKTVNVFSNAQNNVVALRFTAIVSAKEGSKN